MVIYSGETFMWALQCPVDLIPKLFLGVVNWKVETYITYHFLSQVIYNLCHWYKYF